AQNALGGGGRYDGLAAELGWPATPAVGFAAGLDRTVAMMHEEGIEIVAKPPADVLVVPDGPDLAVAAAEVGRISRQVRPAMVDFSDRSLKAKMRAADRFGCRWVAIFNADEARRKVVQLREMASGEQREVAWQDLPEALAS
ncbi:MAG: histidine--tRNA ligase, partial [Chloroflexi bacterium]